MLEHRMKLDNPNRLHHQHQPYVRDLEFANPQTLELLDAITPQNDTPIVRLHGTIAKN